MAPGKRCQPDPRGYDKDLASPYDRRSENHCSALDS